MARVKAQVEVKGVRSLVKKLRKVADEAGADSALVEATKKGAEPIKDAAEQKAPVRTGRLRGNIVIEEHRETPTSTKELSTGGKFIGAGVFSAPGEGLGSQRTFYAHMQEFGTVHHAAQPFLRPAFDEKKREAVRIVREELKRAVEEAAR